MADATLRTQNKFRKVGRKNRRIFIHKVMNKRGGRRKVIVVVKGECITVPRGKWITIPYRFFAVILEMNADGAIPISTRWLRRRKYRKPAAFPLSG